jgi:hypothetical protein
MKSILKKSIIIAAFLFGAVGISNAQVKIGSNPTTIGTNSHLEVEGTTAGKFTITKDSSKVIIMDGSQGIGKVLTSDANGKATWMNSASGSWTAVWYNFSASATGNLVGGAVVKFGDGGNVSPGVIVVPKSGLYKISCSSYAAYQSGSGAANFQMLQNGSNPFYILDNNVSASETGMFISTVQYRNLNAGDVLTVQRQQGFEASGTSSVQNGGIEVTLMVNN